MTVTPTTLLDSNLVFTRLSALATCLCAQITDPVNGVPDVCFCGIVPGEQATALYADGDCADRCGMAWVRLVSLYPSVSIGVLDPTPGNCGSSIGVDVELGIMRCISVGDERGNPPTPDELLAATQLQIADSLVMQRAVLCCDAIPPSEVILSNYTPLGPAGGLVGGMWTLSMGVF